MKKLSPMLNKQKLIDYLTQSRNECKNQPFGCSQAIVAIVDSLLHSIENGEFDINKKD